MPVKSTMPNALLKSLYELEKAQNGEGESSFGRNAETLKAVLAVRGVETQGLDDEFKSMAEAGLLHETAIFGPGLSNERRYVALTDLGRTYAKTGKSPGRGLILDEPHSSALLHLALKSGLVTMTTGTRDLFRRELSRGRSQNVQRELLTALVLFDDVVIPGDKAAAEYFDWTVLKSEAGLRIAPHYSERQRIRFNALEYSENATYVGRDRLSAWDNILRAYLKGRRLPSAVLPDDFANSTSLAHDLNTYATAEDMELYIPDLIEFRVQNFLRDRFGPTFSEDFALVAAARGAFWQIETHFHLQYLKRLTENEWFPGLIRTKLGPVPVVQKLPVDEESQYVYSIFLHEITSLPQPRTLEEAIEWRSARRIQEFREMFFRWHDAISIGDAKEEELRRELRKQCKAASRLKGWGKVAGATTYAGLPAAIAGLAVVNPVVVGAGLATAAIGFVSQVWIDRGSRKNRWMLLSGL
jgi:hypothetical protein